MKTHINKKCLLALCAFLPASTYSMQRIPASVQRLSATRQLTPRVTPRMNVTSRTFSTMPLKPNTKLVRPQIAMQPTTHARGNSTILHPTKSRMTNSVLHNQTRLVSHDQNEYHHERKWSLAEKLITPTPVIGLVSLLAYALYQEKKEQDELEIKSDLNPLAYGINRDYGAQYEYGYEREKEEKRALELIKKAINEKADLNQPDPDNNGNYPLHIACSPEIIQLLIDAGANVNVKNSQKKTPLHIAAAKGNIEELELLIEHKAHVNEQDANGLTPLHYAMINGGYAKDGLTYMVKALLDAGADTEIKDASGNRPFDIKPRPIKIENTYITECRCHQQ